AEGRRGEGEVEAAAPAAGGEEVTSRVPRVPKTAFLNPLWVKVSKAPGGVFATRGTFVPRPPMTIPIRLCALCLALLALAADQPTPRQAELEKQVRELEKQIEKVRGLKFKSPVAAHVIPRPPDAAKGIQGYYDTKKK